MRKYQHFDEVPVWQEAARLYQHVLDLVQEPKIPISATFRSQLERASLCISSSVAEGFDAATNDLLSLLAMARGAAAEVQSMVAVIQDRPQLTPMREPLQQIRTSAEACARQLGAWKHAIENPGQTRRQSAAESTADSAGTSPEQPNTPPGSTPRRDSAPPPPSRMQGPPRART